MSFVCKVLVSMYCAEYHYAVHKTLKETFRKCADILFPLAKALKESWLNRWNTTSRKLANNWSSRFLLYICMSGGFNRLNSHRMASSYLLSIIKEVLICHEELKTGISLPSVKHKHSFLRVSLCLMLMLFWWSSSLGSRGTLSVIACGRFKLSLIKKQTYC